jgi:hypothetical protein
MPGKAPLCYCIGCQLSVKLAAVCGCRSISRRPLCAVPLDPSITPEPCLEAARSQKQGARGILVVDW